MLNKAKYIYFIKSIIEAVLHCVPSYLCEILCCYCRIIKKNNFNLKFDDLTQSTSSIVNIYRMLKI